MEIKMHNTFVRPKYYISYYNFDWQSHYIMRYIKLAYEEMCSRHIA
jgi:hypothetical protein